MDLIKKLKLRESYLGMLQYFVVLNQYFCSLFAFAKKV